MTTIITRITVVAMITIVTISTTMTTSTNITNSPNCVAIIITMKVCRVTIPGQPNECLW